MRAIVMIRQLVGDTDAQPADAGPELLCRRGLTLKFLDHGVFFILFRH